MVNLKTEFNTAKENMYTKLKDGTKLLFEKVKTSELESNDDFGKLCLQ